MLVILNPVQNSYKNCYVIETQCMHGDADAYTNHTAEFSVEEKDACEEVYKALNSCVGTEDSAISLVKKELQDYILHLHPMDCISMGEYYSQLQEVFIRYYDNAGIQYLVKVI